jgi:hypothetical protein
MATQADVRRIALALPETTEDPNRFAFSVLNKGKAKGVAWVWLERIHPKKARVPNPKVIVVAVSDLHEKELLLAANPGKYFTEPHYNGYAAVHIRLADVGVAELRSLIVNAWCCAAPPALVEQFKQQRQRPRHPRPSSRK